MIDPVSQARAGLGYTTHKHCAEGNTVSPKMYFLGGREEGEVIPVVTKEWRPPVGMDRVETN